MSRAYKITVRESTSRELKGSDEICTDLEVLEILPPEQMAELLKKELKEKGFVEREDGKLVRQDGNTTVTVDPKTCEVSVKSDVQEEVSLEARREAFGYDDAGPSQRDIRDRVQQQLKEEIEKKAEKETERLQGRATEALEKKLCDLQPELSEVVNKVTREATMPILEHDVKVKLGRIRDDIEQLGVRLKMERSSSSDDDRENTNYVLEMIRQRVISLLDDTTLGNPPATAVACAVSQEATDRYC